MKMALTIRSRRQSRSESTTTSNTDESSPRVQSVVDRRFDISIHRTFGYDQATQNFIDESQLVKGGPLDVERWNPIFVFDILQLPGTLGTVLGYSSTGLVISRMTPAASQDSDLRISTRCDCDGCEELRRQDGTASDPVKGLVLFGTGGDDRRTLDDFYGDAYTKHEIEVDVTLKSGASKTIKAFAWIREALDWGNVALSMAGGWASEGLESLELTEGRWPSDDDVAPQWQNDGFENTESNWSW